MSSNVLMCFRVFQTKGKIITISNMKDVKQAMGLECFE